MTSGFWQYITVTIYSRKFVTLSNQMSRYICRCIRMCLFRCHYADRLRTIYARHVSFFAYWAQLKRGLRIPQLKSDNCSNFIFFFFFGGGSLSDARHILSSKTHKLVSFQRHKLQGFHSERGVRGKLSLNHGKCLWNSSIEILDVFRQKSQWIMKHALSSVFISHDFSLEINETCQ